MSILFLVLIIFCCLLLGFIVLIQNPKGGGLSGTIAGFNNQFMGVKQTTDVLEKGTWILSGIVVILCLSSLFFLNRPSESNDLIRQINPNTNKATPLPAQPPVQQPVQQPVAPAAPAQKP